MSIQSISTAYLPALESFSGKVPAEKPKATPAVKQVESSNPPMEAKDVKPDEIANKLTKMTQQLGSELAFSVNKELNQVIVTITDLETREVIRQIPSKEMVDLAGRLKELERGGDTKGIILGLKG